MYFTEGDIGLQRAWISELRREHESICWSYRVDLPRPMIEISNSRQVWGSWDVNSRTMRISAVLIKAHSWDVTVNVFKHEMAHQIVTDIFSAADGHGRLFGKACNMIGVPHDFRGARGDLPRRILDFRDDEIDSANVRMLEKVRKLLSLAGSRNENEAFLAMKKANELIEKYNIERIEGDRAARFVYAVIHHKRKRVENYQRRICHILQSHFFVEVVYSRLFDARDCETYKTIELFGTVENVRIAEYVYHFLLNQMEALWKVHQRKSIGRAVGNKRSYRLGVLKGFHDKLNRQAKKRMSAHGREEKTPETLSALICAQDTRLHAFMGTRYPRLTQLRTHAPKVDIRAFQAGIDDGKRITIHKGVQHRDGYQGQLLTDVSERSGR